MTQIKKRSGNMMPDKVFMIICILVLMGIGACAVHAAEHVEAQEVEPGGSGEAQDGSGGKEDGKQEIRIVLRPVKTEGEADPDLSSEVRKQIMEQICMENAETDDAGHITDVNYAPEPYIGSGRASDNTDGENRESETTSGQDTDALTDRLCALVTWEYLYDGEITPPGNMRPAGESDIYLSFGEDNEFRFSGWTRPGGNENKELRSFLTTLPRSGDEDGNNAGTESEAGAGTESEAGGGTGNEAGDGTGNDAGAGTGSETGDGTGSEAGAGTENEAGDGTGSETGAGTGNQAGDGTGNDTESDAENGGQDPILPEPVAEVITVPITVAPAEPLTGDTGEPAAGSTDEPVTAAPAEPAAGVTDETSAGVINDPADHGTGSGAETYVPQMPAAPVPAMLSENTGGSGTPRRTEAAAGVRVSLTRLDAGGEKELTSAIGGGFAAEKQNTMNWRELLEPLPGNDGLYRLTRTETDADGEMRKREVTFSVNRFGSVYSYNDILQKLRGRIVQRVDGDLIITEYNPDGLVSGTGRISLSRDGVTLDSVKYDVKRSRNTKADKIRWGWYRYDYIVAAGNFAKDGKYRLHLSSRDAAGNASENHAYNGGEITFTVDRTAPSVKEAYGLGNSVVTADRHAVGFTVFDAVGLRRLSIYADGKLLNHVDSFEDIHTADIEAYMSAGREQHVLLLAEDMAGNAGRYEKVITVRAGTAGGSGDRNTASKNTLRHGTGMPGNTAAVAAAVLAACVAAGGIALLYLRKKESISGLTCCFARKKKPYGNL